MKKEGNSSQNSNQLEVNSRSLNNSDESDKESYEYSVGHEQIIMNPTVEPLPLSERKDLSQHDDLEANFKRKSSFAESSNPKVQLTWKNVSITTIRRRRLCQKNTEALSEVKILDNVSGTVKPGQFLAIIGSSGAGKTTLLNYLAGKDPSKNIHKQGEVLVNGTNRSSINFEKFIGYVQQDDVLFQTLTVRECLEFAARMKLKPNTDYHKLVDDIIESLKLDRAANTKIGGPLVKGVSGGERKRTSIGVELITDPSLIFLDEPTTGLDSYTATSVIEVLVEMAESGRTVISTIHQPNSEMFSKFNQLMLMANGKTIYMNSASHAISYFSNIGYSCPEHSNPADYFMNMISSETNEIDEDNEDILIKKQSQLEESYNQKIIKFAEYYENSEFKCNEDDISPGLIDLKNSKISSHNANLLMQFYLLLQRALRNSMRISLTSKAKVFGALFLSVMLILIFGRFGKDEKSIQNRNGMLFIIALQLIFISVQGGTLVLPDETHVFYREYSSRMYSSVIYFISKVIGEMPGLIMFCSIITILVYFCTGLNLNDASHFFIFWFYSILASWAALGLGFIPGAMFDNKEVTSACISLLIIPFIVLSGFYINQNNFVIIYPVQYVNLLRYAFQVFLRNEYDGLSLSCSSSCDPFRYTGISESLSDSVIATACLGVGFFITSYCLLMIRTIRNS